MSHYIKGDMSRNITMKTFFSFKKSTDNNNFVRKNRLKHRIFVKKMILSLTLYVILQYWWTTSDGSQDCDIQAAE